MRTLLAAHHPHLVKPRQAEALVDSTKVAPAVAETPAVLAKALTTWELHITSVAVVAAMAL